MLAAMDTTTGTGTTTTGPLARLRRWAHREAQEYRHGEDRPLAGYLTLMSTYSAGTLAAVAAARVLGRRAPARVSPWETVQLGLATHKLSRLAAKDPITSPLRVPFTRYSGLSGPGELAEEVRGTGVRHATGEMLTCPMCLAQWSATALCAGLVLAPVPTRMVLAVLSAVTGADFLQHAYVALQQASE